MLKNPVFCLQQTHLSFVCLKQIYESAFAYHFDLGLVIWDLIF